jgi:hypothetical protein
VVDTIGAMRSHANGGRCKNTTGVVFLAIWVVVARRASNRLSQYEAVLDGSQRGLLGMVLFQGGSIVLFR